MSVFGGLEPVSCVSFIGIFLLVEVAYVCVFFEVFFLVLVVLGLNYSMSLTTIMMRFLFLLARKFDSYHGSIQLKLY